MENKVLFVLFGMFVFGFLLFGCTQYAQAKPNATTNQSANQTSAVPAVTCEEYCPTQSHVQCVGAWSISGTYPNCNCSFICEQIKEEPKVNESNASAGQVPVAPAAPMSAEVEARGYIFTPGTVEIAKGGTVTWTNKDSAQHIILADNGNFESGILLTGQTYSHIYNESGNYSYHCKIHGSMTGMVIVK